MSDGSSVPVRFQCRHRLRSGHRIGFVECDQPGECLGGADPQPGFFAVWIFRHNFNSRPVRHVSNRAWNQAAGFNGTVGLTCQPASTSAQITCTMSPTSAYGRRFWRNGDDDYLHDRAARSLRRHLIAGATWPGLAGGQQQHPVCRHFFAWLALAPPSMTGLGLMLLVFFAAGVGCGGGSSSGGSAQTGGTPKGSYSITVTATSGSLSHTANVAVTVH